MSIENLLYSNYIRYDRMYGLVQHTLRKIAPHTVDVYIDMNSMLRPLYRYDSIWMKDESEITASIINLAAHIREYFWSRHRTMTRIFIVYGDNFPVYSRSINESYNQQSYADYVTKFQSTGLIQRNFEIMDILVPYLNDIFFIHDTEVETSVLINSLIKTNSTVETPKIIYTRDTYAYQLVAMNKRTFLFRPKKTIDKRDESWVVTKKELFNAYCGDTKISIPAGTPLVHHELFSLVLAMSGLRSRNIKGVMRLPTAMKTVNQAVSELLLVQGYNVAFELALNDVLKVKDGDKIETIKSNFLALDLTYNTGVYEAARPGYMLNKYIVNLNDPEAVKDINNKYFIDNPLDLMAL